MEKIDFTNWMPIKAKRKKDGKVIIAFYQQSIYTSHLVWDTEHQYLITPEDEIMLPTPEEIAKLREKQQRKWDDIFKGFDPKAKSETKIKFKAEDVVVKPNPIIEKEVEEKVTMNDFELLTANVESI